MKTKELILQSERNRKRLIEIIYKAKAGHIGGDLSSEKSNRSSQVLCEARRRL